LAYDTFFVIFLYETYAQVLVSSIFFMGFPGGLMVKNPPAMQEAQVLSLGWEDPLDKEKATYSSRLACRIPWTVQSMGLQKSWMQLSDFHFPNSVDSPALHSLRP
jgi:hypothetical protein